MDSRKWICIGLFYSITSVAQNAGEKFSTPGELKIKGEIIEAACEIEYQDRNQWIEFGPITAREILSRTGNSLTHYFQVRLTGCSLESQVHPGIFYKSANITFDSDRVGNNDEIIGITGDAKGFGIRLSDTNGNALKLGTPSSDFKLKDGMNKLGFKATIVPTNNNIKAGEFTATVRFYMDYL